MAFDFNWHDNEHSIIRVDIYGDTNWGEYHKTMNQVVEAVKSSSHRIDIILNDPDSKMPDGSPMSHIKSVAQQLVVYPHMGVIILVSDRTTSTLIKVLISIVYRVYGIDTRIVGEFVNSIKEAEASIAQERFKKISV